MKTFSIGRLFVTLAWQASGAPIIDRGHSVEKGTEGRTGPCRIIRPPFIKHRMVKALVVGIWRKKGNSKIQHPDQGTTCNR